MQLSWGSYSWDADSVTIGKRINLILDAAQRPLIYDVNYDVAGELLETSQSAFTTAIDAMKSALQTPYQDFVFKQDDNADSSWVLRSVNTLTGTRVTNVEFPPGRGAIYATHQPFSFTISAQIYASPLVRPLREFRESLTFFGGGPLRTAMPALRGLPQEQTIYQRTAFEAVQEGQAVGFNHRPLPAPAIWPAKLKQAGRIQRGSPELLGNVFRDFAVTWQYEYVSSTPLVGFPNQWRDS